MKIIVAGAALLLMSASAASAQPVPEPRGIVFTDVGYARTTDDEGLLGSGVGLSGGIGLRVTPRVTLQAVFDYIRYYRDASYLVFDGRVLFGGVEASFQSRRPKVRPFVTIGVGMMNDQKTWTHRSQTGPGQYRVTDVTHHEFTLAMLRSAGGLDFRVSNRVSIRATLRLHSLLDTGDDLAAHIIVQPTVGAAWRW